MNIYQQIVNHKLKNITTDELIMYAKQYNITVTKDQAKDVIKLLKGKENINIFNNEEKNQLLKEIARVTSPQVARQLNQIFMKFLR